jgi:diguanylate cyclase (GGDEF)-like protein
MRILIAEDDAVSNKVLKSILTKWDHEVISVTNGIEAWQIMQEDYAPRLAILDWMMPGLSGVDICRKVRQQISTSPYLILLTALSRKEDVVAGMEAGADDYLTKPVDRQELKVRLQAGIRIVELQNTLAARVRELEAAVQERRKAEEALRNLSLTDDLTGLYNRRGFLTLAQHHIKTTRRTRQSSLLMYCDMDGLKQINDNLGHAEGSEALRQIAEILRQTFRDTDIVGRLGGDEFAVLASAATADAIDTLSQRLQDNLAAHNEKHERNYTLALSMGSVEIEAGAEMNIEAVIAQADERMYIQKRNKKREGLNSGPLVLDSVSPESPGVSPA